MARSEKRIVSVPLQPRVTCSHCWNVFPPEETLWISAHPDLRNDQLLGADHQARFMPTRFTVDGLAIDTRGVTCKQVACPRCHLSLSRAALEMPSLFLSILGAPGSGKSYLLASMTWRLRSTLLKHFQLDLTMPEPEACQILIDYQEKLFQSTQEDQLVSLPKTEKQGDLYESVSIGGRELQCAKPFIFSVRPREGHPSYAFRQQISRAISLYDNAGEHFMPGGEDTSSPVTQHLSLSKALLFLFDPTQHPKFRRACKGKTSDPQIEKQLFSHQQHTVLDEAARRIREQTGLGHQDKYARPLIVAVTKYDAWSSLTRGTTLSIDRLVRPISETMSSLDVSRLLRVSAKIREVLMEHADEIVAAAEGFSREVIYVPCSAIGRGPEVDRKSGKLGFRPAEIAPMWAEVPLLMALHRSVPGLIPAHQSAGEAAEAG